MEDEQRKRYLCPLRVNGLDLAFVIIDQKYRAKHPEMNDEIILSLVQQLRNKEHDPEEEGEGKGFRYFKTEPVYWKNRPYRMIWLLPEDGSYLGVINAFRIPKT